MDDLPPPSSTSRLPRSLRWRFALALLAMAALVVASCALAILALRSSAEASRQLAEERLDRMQMAQSLEQHSLSVSRETFNMLSAESEAAMTESYSEAIRHLDELDFLIVRLGLSASDVTVLALYKTGQLFRNTAHIVAGLRMDALRRGTLSVDQAANLRRFRMELQKQATDLSAATEQQSFNFTRDYRAEVRKLADESGRDQWALFAVIAGSLVLAWLIVKFILNRHVVARLNIVSQYLRHGDADEPDVRIPVYGADEIGEMARAVEQFLEDRRRLRLTQFSIDNAMESALWIGAQANILYVNDAACRNLGYSRDELLTMSIPDIDPAFPAEAWPSHWSELREQGGLTFESSHRRKDGVTFPVEIVANYIRFGEAEYNCVFVRDISERKQAEKDVRQLSRAVEQSPAMILLTNAERRIEYANPRFTSVTGYEVDEILGDKPDILKADNVSSEAFEEVWRAVEAEGEWSGVLINRKKNGNFFWAETHISAITDGAGKVVNYLTTAEDVTERREKEARLAQAEKMQALGGIASGIAHNINNMLLPIIALTEMTMKGLTPEDRNQKRLSKVLSAAHQAKDLVASILTFGREEDVRAVPLNLRETVAAAVALVRSLAPSSVTICENFGEEALTVRGVAGDIQTIIMNLTGNAIDALRGEVGEIEIRLCRVEPDAIELKATPGLELVPHARLTVADTGIGIPPETLDKIFQPFFTTKAVGRGAGLGLSVVNGIVKDYGGGMRVESAVGQGSTFHVFLPLYLSSE